MQKVKVILIGAAFSADLHADGYARVRQKAQIAAIVDKDIARAKDLAARYGFTDCAFFEDYETAVKAVDCDVVDVCLPNFLHKDAALCALRHGRHVISEKPLAVTPQEAREMVKAANDAGRNIYYAEDWLGCPTVVKALELVKSGAIGEVKFIRARECHCGSHSPFAQSLRFCGGGAMIHLGIHPVGLLLALKEGRWTEQTALTSGGLEQNLVHKSMEGEDWAGALVRFADGTTAELEANYVTTGGMEDNIDFYGTKGCLHLDLTFSSAIRGFSIPGFDYTVEKAELTTGWSRPAVDEKYDLGYVSEIEHFIDCIAAGKPARAGLRGEDGLGAMELVSLIYQSAREGRHIKNPREA